MQNGRWYGTSEISKINYTCGYCGTITSPSRFYYTTDHKSNVEISGKIYICANCNQPTYISGERQVPGPIVGRKIEHLPKLVDELYQEARKCITVGANTSAVLACRKLLMNVAVQEGAEIDKSFQYYVNWLEEHHYLPPKGRDWVDRVRKKGNEATHEIFPMTIEDATELINFIEMLLRFVYEFPGTLNKID